MDDAKGMNQLMLQYLSKSPTAITIDGEIGDLGEDVLHGKPALNYLRYDSNLEDENLKSLGFSNVKAYDLREMSASENCAVLMDIGEKSANIEVMENHFPSAFDLKPEKLVS